MAETELILATMLQKDNFSKWLGIIVDEYKVGYCKLHFTITEEMLNGFGIVHGGVVFAAADSAFAFACNSHGNLTVALDASINFIKTALTGDVLTVIAREVHRGFKTGVYDISITNEQNEIVAIFKGTSYTTHKMVCQPDCEC